MLIALGALSLFSLVVLAQEEIPGSTVGETGQEVEIPETTNPVAVPQGAGGGGTQAGGGGQQSGGGGEQPGGGGRQSPTTYLSSLYKWFLGFVAIAALLGLVIGGVLYMFAGANITKTEDARKWITNAIAGILIAAFSYLLLKTINPDLIQGFDIQTVIDKAVSNPR